MGEADRGKHEEAHDDEQDQACRKPSRDETPAALTRQARDHLADLLMFARGGERVVLADGKELRVYAAR